MPQIPDGKNRPTFENTLIDLMESIAMEEMALSHILNAEGEKSQEIIRKFACNQVSLCEMNMVGDATDKIIRNTIMQQWLLQTKLEMVKDIAKDLGACYHRPPCKPHDFQ